MTSAGLAIRVAPGLRQVAAEAWNMCAQDSSIIPRDSKPLPSSTPAISEPSPTQRQPSDLARIDAYNPFISHEFLSALEDSGSVGGRTGWQPRHLLAETVGGTLLGAVPCYLKSHSRGE